MHNTAQGLGQKSSFSGIILRNARKTEDLAVSPARAANHHSKSIHIHHFFVTLVQLCYLDQKK